MASACSGVNVSGICISLSCLALLDFSLRSETSKVRCFVNASVESTSAEL